MPQSFARVLVHLVFSTKHRKDWLHGGIRPGLHAYLSGILMNHNCPAIIVGGTENHVHILLGLARTVRVADLVSALKTGSTKWLKERAGEFDGFHWQNGYGVFSVGGGDLQALATYIARQKDHHRNRTFEEEYRRILQRNGLKGDERYMWD